MVRLEAIELEEGAEKAASRQAEATEKVRPKDDAFAVLRRRRDFFRRRDAYLYIACAG